MLYYVIKVSICWLAFYLLYRLFLHRETFFQINRFYLLLTLGLGLLIPGMDLPGLFQNSGGQSSIVYLQPITIGVQSLSTTLEEIVVTPMTNKATFSIGQLLLAIYWLGVVFFSLRLFVGLYQIWRLYRQGSIEAKGDYMQVSTQPFHLPFSFFHYLFWSKEFSVNATDQAKILQHEMAHIRGRHSLDVLILELIKILLWCSPVIYLYKKSIQNVHEYLADAEVLQTTEKKQYGQLLLRHSQSGLQSALANNFIHSQLKKRIQMMMKHKSKRSALVKYLVAIPMVILMVLLFSNQQVMANFNGEESEKIIPITSQHLNSGPDDPVYKVVEEMPRFPGCEEETDFFVRNNCARKRMLEFLYKNIRYPKAASKDGIEGTTVIRFIIDKQGNITEPEIVRNIGGGCGEEALRVIQTMPQWIPGKQKGKIVKVSFVIPVKFKLEGGSKNKKANVDTILKKVDGSSVALFSIDNTIYDKIPAELDVDQIEEITVMKGDKAVAVYGESARDGIVIITTKKGSKKKAALKAGAHNDWASVARFPGCEAVEGKQERVDCSNKNLLNFVYSNVNYPKAAAKAGVEGLVVVKFLINAEGRITEREIVRSLSDECDEEILRVVDFMADLPDSWTPAEDDNGKAIKSYFHLPVKFKLPAEEEDVVKETTAGTPVVNNLQLEQLKVFPNPAANQLNLSFLSPGGDLQIQISDLNGKLLFSKKVDDAKGLYSQSIDLSNMARGAVLLSIIQGEKRFTEKVVLQ